MEVTVWNRDNFLLKPDSPSLKNLDPVIKKRIFLEMSLQLYAGLQQDYANTKIPSSISYTFYRKGYIGSEAPAILLNVSWQGRICI
jgi:hypothetical protein